MHMQPPGTLIHGFGKVTRYYTGENTIKLTQNKIHRIYTPCYCIITYGTSRVIPASACLLLKQYLPPNLRDKRDKTFIWSSLCCSPAHQTLSFFQTALFCGSSILTFRCYVLWLQLSFGKVIYMLPCTGIIGISLLLKPPNDWLLQSCFICLW